MMDGTPRLKLRAGDLNVKRETTFFIENGPLVGDFYPAKAVLREFVSGGRRAYIELSGPISRGLTRSKKFAVYGTTGYSEAPTWLIVLIDEALRALSDSVPG